MSHVVLQTGGTNNAEQVFLYLADEYWPIRLLSGVLPYFVWRDASLFGSNQVSGVGRQAFVKK